MWHSSTFRDWLMEENGGSDVWKKKIQPAMKRASVLALKGAQGSSGCSARTHTFEVNGLDVIIVFLFY